MIQEEINKYIRTNNLLIPGMKVIVGFSGGADSVMLLHFLQQAGCQCIAAHCNFHLRGEESQRDEAFARQLAESLQIPFVKTDFDTHACAVANGISIEMAARKLRYDWFETLRIQYNADAIAVGHHKDDSVETVLLNLIRGTGIRGLTGIRPRNGYIIRPLLCISKSDILTYIQENGLDFVTDSTNLEDIHTRNKIRLQVIPLLETINPSISESIERTARNLAQAETIYNKSIEKGKSEVFSRQHHTINIRKLRAFPSPETLLYEILSGYGFNYPVTCEIMEALEGQPGKTFFSPTHRLVKDREKLIISSRAPSEEQENTYIIPEETEETTFPLPLKIQTRENHPGFIFNPDKHTAYFDRDQLRFPLTIRKWRSGDHFIPFGMNSKQKISKYFKDHQYHQVQKEEAWILCSGEDIIWIVGERADNRYRVNDRTTVIYQIQIAL